MFLSWKLVDGGGARGPALFRVSPLCSGRDYHTLHRRNDLFGFESRADAEQLRQHLRSVRESGYLGDRMVTDFWAHELRLQVWYRWVMESLP